MPKYKLIYFDGRGRAELARWLFAYGGIPFVDERIDFNDWPKHKANYPTGQLPVLMIDDQLLTEPIAIARYIAKEVDLLPKDNLEAAFCDALVDNSVQVLNNLYEALFSSKEDSEKKTECKEIANPYLTRLTNHLEGKQWFISNKMTWADFEIAYASFWIMERAPELLEGFEVVKSHMKKICDLSPIKKWIESHPVKEY